MLFKLSLLKELSNKNIISLYLKWERRVLNIERLKEEERDFWIWSNQYTMPGYEMSNEDIEQHVRDYGINMSDRLDKQMNEIYSKLKKLK
jgi:hypothetical protein